jgi:hypothetical protein
LGKLPSQFSPDDGDPLAGIVTAIGLRRILAAAVALPFAAGAAAVLATALWVTVAMR